MPLGLNSISGLISGLDTASLVDSLIQFERRPAFLLEARRAQEELRLASYDALEGGLASLKAQLDILRRPADFQMRTANVSHAELLSATVNEGAAAGSYTLRIQQLAQSHQLVSDGYADEESALGTGSVTISLAGEEALTVNLSEGGDSLRDLADAINNAGAGISANILNTGNGETPYQLVISGGATGAEQIVTVESDLSGGAGLSLGGVGNVVYGTPPSAAVTSSGHYSGAADAEFSFTVSTGGTVGTDSIVIAWENDQGESGEITLDDSYVAGEEVHVHGGLMLSFGAGELEASSSWSVATGTSSIQAAQDAIVSMGSAGTPLEIYSSDNTINDMIPGVTLNLLAADAEQDLTLQVQQDTDGMIARLSGFVDEYNSVINYLNAQLDYNEFEETAGVFLGDQVALRLDSQLRSEIVQTVQGLSSEFSQLSEIGIGMSVGGSLSTDGTLSIDEATLREALDDDINGVISLLASTGEAVDEDIIFLNAGSDSIPTGIGDGYELHVTQAARRGIFVGTGTSEPTAFSPLNIDSSNRYMKISVNGVTSTTIALDEGSVESGAELASLIQAAINNDEELDTREVLVNWVDDGGGNGHLEIVSKTYGANSEISLEDVDNSIYADAGLEGGLGTAGQDVAGYFLVNGEQEEATGSGRILTGSQERAASKSISVQVNLTEEMLTSQGEIQGAVKVFSGVTDRLHRTLDNYLDGVDGIIAHRQEGMRSTITDFDKQIAKVDERLEIRRERYLREFLRMEELMAKMNSTSSAFQSMIMQVPGIGTGA